MWRHEESIETSATSARILELFADVAGWKNWNAGIEFIELHGPFQEGTTFTMRPPGQDDLTSTLIAIKPNQGFTDETVVGDIKVIVYHKIISLPSGRTPISYRTEVIGPDAEEIGSMVTADFPDVVIALKKQAEDRA